MDPATGMMLLSTGLSFLGGLFGRKKNSGDQTVTQKIDLTPDQQAVSTALGGSLQRNLLNPARHKASGTHLRSQGRSTINKALDTAQDRVTENFASRGMARSGQAQKAFTDLEDSRVGQITALDNEIMQYLYEQQVAGEQRDIQNALAFLPAGANTTAKTDGAGRGFGSAVGQGLETFVFLNALNGMLGGGSQGRGT